jgi:benzoyl-CoA 2,3-epoxidase subunit B
VQSLRKPCFERGQTASWIAPPAKGINNLAVDYEYVKLGA